MKHSKKLVTLSVLTTMSGAAIYFLNKTLDTAAVRKNLLASAEKEIFSWQFGDIFYTKKGTGTPMLLLHDLHCASSGREWQYIEDALAQDHTVYTLDLLGCGRSDKPAITYTKWSNGEVPAAAAGSNRPRSYRAAYANPTAEARP